MLPTEFSIVSINLLFPIASSKDSFNFAEENFNFTSVKQGLLQRKCRQRKVNVPYTGSNFIKFSAATPQLRTGTRIVRARSN